MKAYRLMRWRSAPELRDMDVPRPGSGEVLLKVGGAGACHSDLHLMDWPEGTLPYDLPFTLGHENAGWVEELGPGVEGFKRGDPVLVYGPWGCGHCRTCRTGQENYCENAARIRGNGGGLGLDGGMAEYMRIPSARFLVPLRALKPQEAAPLADAALTPYHAIKRSLPLLGTSSTAVVIGVGGLGEMAVQLLEALTPSTVVAIDVAEEKRALAKKLGAEDALAPGDAAIQRVQELTCGLGAELVVDMVGNKATLELAAKLARRLGHLTIVGLGGGTLPVSFFGVPYECSIATTYWGSVTELMEVVALAEAKKIHTEVELFPLARAAEAYQRLKDGRIRGRAVITPNG